MDFSENTIAKTILIAAILLLLVRFVPALWGSLFFVAVLAPFVGLIWWLSRRKQRGVAPGNQDQLQLAIEEKIKECKQRSASFRQEANTIRQQYLDLATQMGKVARADSLAQQKGQDLLTKFDDEMNLRLAKAAFFESSQAQLEQMLENRRLQQKLEESEAALQQWQDANFEDLESIESMRERIRLDQAQLELISELAQRAAISPDLQQAVALRRELEAIKLQP